MSNLVQKLIEAPKVKQFLGENSTFKIFVAVVGGIVAAAGLIGKVLDLDKTVALWLSHAVKIDPATKVPELEHWFVPVVFLEVLLVASLAMSIIWAVTRRYVQTEDQKALMAFMSSVRQIRDQGKQANAKSWVLESLHLVYLINKDFSGSVRRLSVIKAVDAPLHFCEITHGVEETGDAAASLAALNYEVRDLDSPTTNIAYLPSENRSREKRACVFFLPPIPVEQSRKFEITYQWPGMFKGLKKDSEDFEYAVITSDALRLYRLEVYLQEGAGGRLEGRITGATCPGQILTEGSYKLNGWSGHGFIYEVKDIPAGPLNLTLRTQIKN